MEAMLILAAVMPVVAGLVVLLIALIAPKKTCPDCGAALPRFRKPQTWMQTLWGGWTCPKCGAHLNRQARKIPAH